MLGRAVVNGLHIPITGIRLCRRTVVFQCTLEGPVEIRMTMDRCYGDADAPA